MIQGDRIGEYLRQLTPQARSSLLVELERLEACGAAVPGTATMLENLRAELRKGGQSHHRVANPSRYFFSPVESLLVDGAPEHDNSGRILRGSLAAIWEWISRDLLPTMTNEYVTQMRPLIAADKQPEIRKVAAAFQTKVVTYLDSALGSPDGAARARSQLATYTASCAAYNDLLKLMCVLRKRDALAKLNDALQKNIVKFDGVQVARITALLDAFRKRHPEALPFALTLVAKQLKTFWQLVRLATKAAPSRYAADIAATPYAIAVSMVLDRLQDKGTALRAALKTNKVIDAKELLVEIYDAEYELRVGIDRLDQSPWGARLDGTINWIGTLIEAEVSKFPKEVGHVLASRSLRSRRSLLGRLSYYAWKGRDVLSSGVVRCVKSVGQSIIRKSA
jgi:hypothetical protein